VNRQQRDTVLDHLMKAETITAAEARLFYRIESLTSRISELRRDGWVLAADWFCDPTGKRFKRYRLVGVVPRAA
jgi:hypothetical protein